MKRPMDRQPPAARRGFDATGKPPAERISDYFDFETWPEKAERKVTRIELLAILTQLERGKKEQRFLSRLWRFVRRPVGDGPVPATEPTRGEVERGERTAT
jgi:hypothetical protein